MSMYDDEERILAFQSLRLVLDEIDENDVVIIDLNDVRVEVDDEIEWVVALVVLECVAHTDDYEYLDNEVQVKL